MINNIIGKAESIILKNHVQSGVIVTANTEVSFKFVVDVPKGYKAITLIPHQTGAYGVFYCGCNTDDGKNMTVWLHNTDSTTKTAEFVCNVVCVKNESI